MITACMYIQTCLGGVLTVVLIDKSHHKCFDRMVTYCKSGHIYVFVCMSVCMHVLYII